MKAAGYPMGGPPLLLCFGILLCGLYVSRECSILGVSNFVGNRRYCTKQIKAVYLYILGCYF